MPTHREQVRLPPNETFRLLRWHRNVVEVDTISSSGRISRVAGLGNHWHYHPALELTLIKTGGGTRLVADDIDLFEAGDLVLIGPNVPHYWKMRGPSSGLTLQWDFPEPHRIWNLPETFPLHRLITASRRGLHVSGATAVAVTALMEQIPRSEGLHRLGLFLQILGLLCKIPAPDSTPLSAQSFSLSSSPETRNVIQRAVSFILAHHRESFSLSDLVELTGMSRSTFARQFLLHVGKPFSTFRNQVRIRAVCDSLRHTDARISTIAFDHGFNQLSFFNRLFRREFGMNPRDYRKRHAPHTTTVESAVFPNRESSPGRLTRRSMAGNQRKCFGPSDA